MDLANGYTFVMYWMENPAWYRVNKDLDRFELTEAAPEEARSSFEVYKKINGLTY